MSYYVGIKEYNGKINKINRYLVIYKGTSKNFSKNL